MIDVPAILALHEQTVVAWHAGPMTISYDGVMQIIGTQHSFNFMLWHEEDRARSRGASDAEIAEVKRNIDRLNQQRNDAIEAVDDWIVDYLRHTPPPERNPAAPLNTETPGSAIDRLSIMALRIYHLREQLDREDVDDQHRESVRPKLERCDEQRRDLAEALQELLRDMERGAKRHKVYRQFKMYNDPTLNPQIYQRVPKRRRFPKGPEGRAI